MPTLDTLLTDPVDVVVHHVPGQPWIGGDLARRFWLPSCGPSTFLFVAALTEHDGETVDLLRIAQSVGIGKRSLPRTLSRARRLAALTIAGTTVEVRGTFGRLPAHHARRLPSWIAAEYQEWEASLP